MEKGTVKFFNDTKGYGFITCEDNTEIFFHISGTKEKVKKGDKVQFDVEQGKKGDIAIDIAIDIVRI